MLQPGEINKGGDDAEQANGVLEPVCQVEILVPAIYVGGGRTPGFPTAEGLEDILVAALFGVGNPAVGAHIAPRILHKVLAQDIYFEKFAGILFHEFQRRNRVHRLHAQTDEVVKALRLQVSHGDVLVRIDFADDFVLFGREPELLHFFIGAAADAGDAAPGIGFGNGIAQDAQPLETAVPFVVGVGSARRNPCHGVHAIVREDVACVRGAAMEEVQLAILGDARQQEAVPVDVVHTPGDKILAVERHGNRIRQMGVAAVEVHAVIAGYEAAYGVSEEAAHRTVLEAIDASDGYVERRGADVAFARRDHGGHPGQGAPVGVVGGNECRKFAAIHHAVHVSDDAARQLRIGPFAGELWVFEEVHLGVCKDTLELGGTLLDTALGFHQEDVLDPLGIVLRLRGGPLPANWPCARGRMNAGRVGVGRCR